MACLIIVFSWKKSKKTLHLAYMVFRVKILQVAKPIDSDRSHPISYIKVSLVFSSSLWLKSYSRKQYMTVDPGRTLRRRRHETKAIDDQNFFSRTLDSDTSTIKFQIFILLWTIDDQISNSENCASCLSWPLNRKHKLNTWIDISWGIVYH
jgi:hypothetical protein